MKTIKTKPKNIHIRNKIFNKSIINKRKIDNINNSYNKNEKNNAEFGNNSIKNSYDSIFDNTKNNISRVNRVITNKIINKGVDENLITPTQKVKKNINKQKKNYKRTKKTIKEIENIIKKIYKVITKMVKGIAIGIKSLISLIIAGGTISLIIIVLMAIIALFCGSIYGIFLSSEKTNSNSITMNECIVSLNNEMDNKIKEIENITPHDEIVIDSNKAEWRDILAIYTVKISNGNNNTDVLTINDDKKNILKEIFWDMNSITSNLVIEQYDEDSTIDSWDIEELDLNEIKEKRVLYININSKKTSDMIEKYNFNDLQLKQYNELTSEKYLSLWNYAIYGMYGTSGEFTTWKQKDLKWANIKIGTTDKTLGRIGCLVTSISMLIKKSNVPTKDIYPFNPATFVIALNNNYGFDKKGNLKYNAINKAVPNFKYVGHVNLRGKSKSEKLYEIQKYLENGYYLSAEVKGATKNSQHWVAIDNVVNDKVLMLDPASDENDMWKKYDWNNTTQFVYFKVLV